VAAGASIELSAAADQQLAREASPENADPKFSSGAIKLLMDNYMHGLRAGTERQAALNVLVAGCPGTKDRTENPFADTCQSPSRSFRILAKNFLGRLGIIRKEPTCLN